MSGGRLQKTKRFRHDSPDSSSPSGVDRRYMVAFRVGDQDRKAVGRPHGYRYAGGGGPAAVGFRRGPFILSVAHLQNLPAMNLTEKADILPRGRGETRPETMSDPPQKKEGMPEKHLGISPLSPDGRTVKFLPGRRRLRGETV